MKRLYTLLIVAFTAIFLLACGTDTADVNQGKTGEPLYIGMEAAYPPYNWTQTTSNNDAIPIQNSDDFANGYDAQITKIISDQTGRPVEVVKTSWEGLVPALQSDKIDLIIAGMTPTAERSQAIDFTDSYYDVQFTMVVSKDSEYANATSIEDFSGARLTGQQGTLHYDILEQIPGVDVQQALTDFSSMRVALQSGKIDGYISEYPEAVSATAALEDLIYVELPDAFTMPEGTADHLAIGVKPGNDALLNEVNDILAQVPEEQRAELMDQAIANQPSTESDLNLFGFVANMWAIFTDNLPAYLNGIVNTILISIIGTLIGLVIGTLVGIIRSLPYSKTKWREVAHRIINGLLGFYIAIFRGTPMIVQAMVFYYGSALVFSWDMHPMTAAFIVVSINTGAYMAEVVRGGINSIDPGQFEGAKSIGMSHFQTMKEIILPQAFKTIMPSVANEFVINIKDTSVLNVISVNELYFTSNTIASNNYLFFETFLVTAIIYFILTWIVTLIIGWLEKSLSGSDDYEMADIQSGQLQVGEGAVNTND